KVLEQAPMATEGTGQGFEARPRDVQHGVPVLGTNHGLEHAVVVDQHAPRVALVIVRDPARRQIVQRRRDEEYRRPVHPGGSRGVSTNSRPSSPCSRKSRSRSTLADASKPGTIPW